MPSIENKVGRTFIRRTVAVALGLDLFATISIAMSGISLAYAVAAYCMLLIAVGALAVFDVKKSKIQLSSGRKSVIAILATASVLLIYCKYIFFYKVIVDDISAIRGRYILQLTILLMLCFVPLIQMVAVGLLESSSKEGSGQ